MAADWRRGLRLFFKFGLLVSLPLTGYLWAQTGASPLAMAMTGVSVVMALGAEGLASAAEGRLSKLKAIADAEDASFNAEVTTREEKIRQMDRIVETLSNQNHDLRGKLVSIHGETHRLAEEMAQFETEALPDGAAVTEETSDDSTGDVTDISSLRTLR